MIPNPDAKAGVPSERWVRRLQCPGGAAWLILAVVGAMQGCGDMRLVDSSQCCSSSSGSSRPSEKWQRVELTFNYALSFEQSLIVPVDNFFNLTRVDKSRATQYVEDFIQPGLKVMGPRFQVAPERSNIKFKADELSIQVDIKGRGSVKTASEFDAIRSAGFPVDEICPKPEKFTECSWFPEGKFIFSFSTARPKVVIVEGIIHISTYVDYRPPQGSQRAARRTGVNETNISEGTGTMRKRTHDKFEADLRSELLRVYRAHLESAYGLAASVKSQP